MKKILFIVFITSFLLVGAGLALACSCVANQTVEEYFETANTVFSGKVTNIDKPTSGVMGGTDPVTVNFLVYRGWKGFPPENIIIKTGLGGGDCGYPFIEGKEYLVYSFGNDGVQGTNICSGTKLLSEADNDILLLGPGGLPDEGNVSHEPIQKDVRVVVYNIVNWIFNTILAIVLITLLYGIVKRISYGRKLKQVDQLEKQLNEKILKKKHHYQKIIVRALAALIVLFFFWVVNTFKTCCA